jgi:L-iditol 2-dehydrogenase
MANYPKTMKALAAYRKTDYRFESAYPSPECGDDGIIIKTEGCGICAGDLNRHGTAMFWGVQPSWVKPPFIPGREFLGRIVDWEKGFDYASGTYGDLKAALVP